VAAILGVTYTGRYEPVRAIAAALDRIQADTGLYIPIRVDAASGGFIAPFLQPELEWDFRVSRVHSISTSAHKYGLVYPGLGWVVWRSAEYLPDNLIFKVGYLGGSLPTFALNFSRPGAQVLLQYYNFLRLGHKGYRSVQQVSHDVARHLASEIAKMAPFEILGDGSDLPVVVWRMKHGCADRWDLYDLGNQLRQRRWLVPAYQLPDALSDLTVQRIVVRNGLTMDLAEILLDDIADSVRYLEGLDRPLPREGRKTGAFHH
jgi:glutamate decarboxylase